MSAEKHAPEPWNANFTRLNGKAVGFHITDKNGSICPVCEHYDAYGQMSADEIEANARLISAAPEMLAVLQELAESTEYWSEYDVPLGIVDRIKAAIAKAGAA